MATVRPFPDPPALLMNTVSASSFYTINIQTIGLLNTIRDIEKKETTGFEIELNAASANITVKRIGALIIELPITQHNGVFKPNYQIDLKRTPCRDKSDDKILDDKNLINRFLIGKIKL